MNDKHYNGYYSALTMDLMWLGLKLLFNTFCNVVHANPKNYEMYTTVD
jgi:hypothetical protein